MAGSIIGSLRAVLGIDTAQFDEGLSRSQGKLSNFARAGQVAGAAAAAAIATGAAALGAAITSTINRADELSKAAQKFGVGVEQLSRLAYAADLSDVSLEGLGTGLKKLSANMADVASGGTGKAAGAFKALGISVTDASGNLRSNEAVLEDVAGKFGEMQDGAGKTAYAMAIFGKSGADLIPMLNSGRDGLREMTKEADELGLTISQKTAVQAEAFNDNLTRLKAVGQGVSTQITAGLLPGLTSLSDTIVSGAKNTQFMSAVTSTLNGTLKVLSVTGVILGAVFDATFKTVMAVSSAVMHLLRGDFSGALEQLNKKLDSFDGLGERVSKAWNATAGSVKGAAEAVDGKAAPAIERGAKKAAKGLSEQEKATKSANDELDRYLENLKRQDQTAGLSRDQIEIMDLQANALKALALGRTEDAHALTARAAALIEADKINRSVIDTDHKLIRTSQDVRDSLVLNNRDIENSFDSVLDSVARLLSALKSGDWGQALSGFAAMLKGVGGGLAGSLVNFLGRTGVGMSFGQLAGLGTGKGGLDLGLGLAGSVGGAALAGSSFAGVLGAGAANIASGLGLGAALSSGIGSALMSASVLGPIGAIVALGLGSLLKGKPSNNAGIAQLTPDSYELVSSGKETAETKQAASAAADAILQGEALLKAAGVKLARTVAGVDIGTRDKTNIVLSDGSQFRTSSVGDPAEAAEAALKAVLEGASYVDETQKKLVESMLAAGKGFDDISAALQGYRDAQAVSGQLADAILQLTDPKAFELKGVDNAIQAQRDAAQASADAGYLTADQLATINGQLDELRKLQIDAVMKRYAGAVDAAADAGEAVSAAQDALRSAYDAQADVLRDTIDRYKGIASGLRDFGESVRKASASGPSAALAMARATFNALAGRTDADSLEKLKDAGSDLLDAAKSGARDEVELARIQAQVRAATEAGAEAAEAQVDKAELQLQVLTDQVSKLIEINKSVLTVADAIAGLQGAFLAQAKADPTKPLALNDNDAAATYLAANADVAASAIAGWLSTVNISDLTGDGTINDLDRAKWHFLNYGASEGRKFATGGGFRIGGPRSGDRVPVGFMGNGGEYVNITREDAMSAMASEISALRRTVDQQANALQRVAAAADEQFSFLRGLSPDGLSLRMAAA